MWLYVHCVIAILFIVLCTFVISVADGREPAATDVTDHVHVTSGSDHSTDIDRVATVIHGRNFKEYAKCESGINR